MTRRRKQGISLFCGIGLVAVLLRGLGIIPALAMLICVAISVIGMLAVSLNATGRVSDSP